MADEKTQGQGRGWHGDPEGHARAGEKGGEKVARERGSEFYQEIGEKGGEASPTKFKAGDPRTREIARKGGEASGRRRDSN